MKNFFVLEASKVARYAIPFAVSIKHLIWKKPKPKKDDIFSGKTKAWSELPLESNWNTVSLDKKKDAKAAKILLRS